MDSKYVILISSDGYPFVISKSAAFVSGTLRGMLSSDAFEEGLSNRVKLPNISAILLEKVCEYLNYNLKYKDDAQNIPDFEIPPEMALELLVAADYLDGVYC
jgi:transcription elongation factor B subunit 1